MDKGNAMRATKVVVAMGIDTAKSTFSVCGVDGGQRVVLERTLTRAKLRELMANMPPCLVGMEACSGSHQLARELIALGHTVRIMAAKFVLPHRSSGKNDRNDARAIVDALVHPRTRFVPVKSEEQQALLSVQRARAGFVAERTALANRIRRHVDPAIGEGGLAPALLGQFRERDVVLLKELRAEIQVAVIDGVHERLAQRDRDPHPGPLIEELHAHLLVLDERIGGYERQVREQARQSEAASRLMEVLGIGAITAMSTVALVGNAREFKNGRQFAAWLGLVPRQHSTGGKTRLGAITREGDVYLRALYVQCAKALLAVAGRRKDRLSQWALAVQARRGFGKAAVAVAAKLARIAWALLAKGERFRAQATEPTAAA